MKTCGSKFGAGDESRTRDLNLGKVALYQLSYSRIGFLWAAGLRQRLAKTAFFIACRRIVILSAVALINLVIDQKARILHDFFELVLPAVFSSAGFAFLVVSLI